MQIKSAFFLPLICLGLSYLKSSRLIFRAFGGKEPGEGGPKYSSLGEGILIAGFSFRFLNCLGVREDFTPYLHMAARVSLKSVSGLLFEL